MSYRHGWTVSGERADDIMAEAHIECIECQEDGCTGCPSPFCERPLLVECCGEHMHAGCVADFHRHVENKAVA